MTEEGISVKDRLRAYMNRSRISQTGLATIIGIPETQIWKYLNTEDEFPKYDLLAVAFLEGIGRKLEEINAELNRMRNRRLESQMDGVEQRMMEARRRFLHWQRSQLMADALLPAGRQMGRPVMKNVIGNR
ncbi:MAG TPA: hypothetical protein PLR69_08300 [Candidatus Limiplasma sp.]|nr:hypothetical protein [Candidatus Limiplasma sp.]